MVKKSDLIDIDESGPEEKDPAGNGGSQQPKAARKKTTLRMLEGDETRGITEETEEALKPEERSVSEILLGFAKYPIIATLVSFIVILLFLWWPWGFGRAVMAAFAIALVIGVAVSIAVIMWIKVISSSPPFVGLVTLFGRITDWVAPAGYFLTIPYIRDIIPIDMRRIDQDFKLENVVTKDNAIVAVKGHLSFQPDPKRLPMYIKSGVVKRGEKNNPSGGVMLITDNLFPQYQRTEIKKLPLDDALGASETLSAGIAKHLTGEKDFDRGNMARDGRSDTKGLGITIFVANVTSIETAGATKKALEMAIQEKLQRKAEVYEVVTRGKQTMAKMFIRKGIDITELEPNQITEQLEGMRQKDPEKFNIEFDEFFENLFEWQLAKEKPGVIIPGMRRRLATQGGSIPLDIIGASLAGLFHKPTDSKTGKTEKPKNTGKGKKKKEESEEEYEEEYEEEVI